MADAGEIKNININTVRSMLKQKGIMSKDALSRSTGLSFSTICRLVDSLVLSDELIEKGPCSSTGGRCAQLYALNPIFQVILTLQLEARQLSWSVDDLDGNSLEEGSRQCDCGLLETINQLIVDAKRQYPQLSAIAMGLAGTVYNGIVTELFGYDELRGINLREHIEAKSHLPAVIEGDMIAASLGYCSRYKETPKAAVCIYLGHLGIGAGLVINGNVWRGASEFAGELHFLPIKNNLEYVQTNFEGVDIINYYSKIIRSYIALVNPDRIVLYENDFITGKTDEIRRESLLCLPSQAIPQIEVSNHFNMDYKLGLMTFAYEIIEKP